MRIVPARLRRGEVIAGAAGMLLLALMFLVPWYGLTGSAQRSAAALGAPVTVDGFIGLSVVRWPILLAVFAALSLLVSQVTQRAPALPVSFSVIATVLGAVVVLALLYRVLINVPGPDSRMDSKLGAYLGLLVACGLTYGAASSLREETPPGASSVNVRTVTLPHDG
jgi:hypothetical protein